jgi:hypothetical protein
MNVLSMIRIVLWSFFGVRKKASHEADFTKVNFVFLPFVAVGLALLVGAVLLGIVLLVAHPTATAQSF